MSVLAGLISIGFIHGWSFTPCLECSSVPFAGNKRALEGETDVQADAKKPKAEEAEEKPAGDAVAA